MQRLPTGGLGTIDTKQTIGIQCHGLHRVESPEELVDQQSELAAWLNVMLRDLLPASGTPGAAVGVLSDDRIQCAAAGVLNLETGEPVTPQTFFQIGSITKLFTAVLALQQAAAGRVDLDAPVRRYLPEFKLADENAAATVTLRHLLTHSSGIDGDVLVECPQGPNRLAAYVETLAEVSRLHAPGARVAYCNAGFVLTGRLIEVLTGQSWHTALRQEILAPLGISAQTSEAERVPNQCRATGHVSDPNNPGALKVPTGVGAIQTCAPAGTTLTMSVSGLLAFVHALMRGGAALDGTRILPEEIVRAMLRPQVALPRYAAAGATHWGLGPLLYRWNGNRLWGHDGDTGGFLAFLRVDPATGTAAALLTNGGRGVDLANEVFARVFRRLSGLQPPPCAAVRPELPVCAESYVGRYRRLHRHTQVEAAGNGLTLRVAETDAGLAAAPPLLLTPVEEHVFRFRLPQQDTPSYIEFADFDDAARAHTIFSGYRLSVREA